MATPQIPATPLKKRRRYQVIWEEIKSKGRCQIECPRVDTQTIINMVHKEKKFDKSPELKGKVLQSRPTDTGVLFVLVQDTSIRNLVL